ncbi:MAG: DUF1080 domain-containing protein [Acidobacteria bacterium]|nr:DUF1080 domain-containing protein [Acidobacteriota bacterium]MBI3470257.1 DUF1080 domain-containing protein [Candidatus Solibacter usitatus]
MKLITISLFAALLAAQPNALTPQEAADGWILLFDGESLFGWTSEGQSQWRAAAGVLVADSGGPGWLRHNSVFADYVLKCEFRSPPDGNSGIFLRSAKEGQPHLTGYELQIYDTQPAGYNTGSLVGHIKAKEAVKLTGGWQSYEVEVTGNHFLVKLDGKTVLFGRDDKSKLGHLGLQYNKDKKIEFRNIKLKPLGLQPIFNGKDLKGWQVVDTPRAKEKPVWSAKDGQIHVEKGPGQLETEQTWDDFVLQLDIRTNASGPAHHPNSGVFIRGDKNGFWTGYESQIRNEYKDGDRAKAVDFGTGGVYHFQAARKVVSNDNEYFTKTVVARGRHIAVWVNGYPVSDYEDDKPEGMDARKQARIAAGTISLQAHDPTTNLDFKSLRIVPLPR